MKEGSFDQSEHEVPKAISASGNKNEAFRSTIQRMGPICKSRTKSAVFVPGPSEEDVLVLDLGKERTLGDGECMWLSSGASSPLPFFKEYRLSTPLRESVDEWLVYWLSTLADSCLYLDKARNVSDESRVNPNRKEEGRLPLLPKVVENDAEESPVVCSERPISSRGQGFTGDDVDSLTHFSTKSGSSSSCSSSQISNLDRASFLSHLMNLDGEDSKWSSDADLELDSFESSFPSPTCGSSAGSGHSLASSSSVSTPERVADEQLQHDISSQQAILEAEDLQDSIVDEPLFWPFDRKPDWSLEETWRCFTMSPRKSISKQGTPVSTSANSDSKNWHSSRITSSSTSTGSKILDWKKRNINIGNQKTYSSPSRLRKSTKNAMTTFPSGIDNGRKILSTETNFTERKLLEDGIASKAELSIETLMGLGEFDGHEGVDSEFNEDVFCFGDSLYE